MNSQAHLSDPQPLLTFITACFNSALTLDRTIESVAKQLGPSSPVEYVVVDGGSTDGTIAVIRRWQEAGVITKWLSEPDKGMYDAMNKGIALASGQYLCMLNSDDTFGINALEKCIEAAKSGVSFFFGRNDFIAPDGSHISKPLPKAMIMSQTICCHQALWVRADIVRALGGYDTGVGLAAEQDFMIRLFNRHKDCLMIDSVLCTFYAGGLSSGGDYHESERLVRLRNLEILVSFGQIDRLFAESFLYDWSGKILFWAKAFSGHSAESNYLATLGQKVGLQSDCSFLSLVLLRMTLLIFRFRALFLTRKLLRAIAYALHLHSLHSIPNRYWGDVPCKKSC